jgi:acetyl-CoA synthetase
MILILEKAGKHKMNFLDCYLSRTEFNSYEDFVENFKINVPENFNFAFDIVDEYAKLQPDKKAMVWCNEAGDEKTFTFADICNESNQIANFLKSLGIKKGDPVMLMLKRRHEFWSCLVALHKIGAVAIPATHMLTYHDIVYRNNAADIKMIITVDDPHMMDAVDEAEKDSPTLKFKAAIRTDREGWFDLHQRNV